MEGLLSTGPTLSSFSTRTYFIQNVKLSEKVKMDRVFLGVAGLPLEIPRSSPASPLKVLPPLHPSHQLLVPVALIGLVGLLGLVGCLGWAAAREAGRPREEKGQLN